MRGVYPAQRTLDEYCMSYETRLLAFELLCPTPIGRDECPECGGTEFEFVG